MNGKVYTIEHEIRSYTLVIDAMWKLLAFCFSSKMNNEEDEEDVPN